MLLPVPKNLKDEKEEPECDYIVLDNHLKLSVILKMLLPYTNMQNKSILRDNSVNLKYRKKKYDENIKKTDKDEQFKGSDKKTI